MTFLRTLAATGWLALALLVSVVLTLGYGSWDANRDAKAVRHAGTVKGELAVANAGQAAAHASVTALENAAEAARASQVITDRNHAEILSTPGANASIGAVSGSGSDSGLRVLCERPAYANDPRCRSVRAWVAFAEAQTGRLEVANANRNAVVQIVDACGRQQAAIREALKPKPRWRRLFD